MSADAPRIDVAAIAFDLDGTLLDTIHDLAVAINVLLAECGYPTLPKDAIRGMVGKGIANLVERAIVRASGTAPDAPALTDALERYYVHYAAQLGRETRVFPGAIKGLERLAAMGVPLAVITNKAARFVRPHLVAAGMEPFFHVVIGGDDLPTRKPDAGPLLHVCAALGVPSRHLLMVGDSGNDVAAARAAGCPVLVVPYGYSEGTPVQDLGADGIVSSLDALAERVRYIAPESR